MRHSELDEQYNKQNEKKESSFTVKMTNRILKNIQIKLKNVYVRFDDKLSGASN